MELLKLVECTDDIIEFYEFLGSLADACLDFEVLLEVIGTHFVVDAEQVVELFALMLEILPGFGSIFGRYGSDFPPFCLEGFEVFVVLVDTVGVGNHLLDFLDDVKFLLEILLAFSFSLCSLFGTLFLDGGHEALEFCLQGVLGRCEILSITASFDESLTCGGYLFVVHLVETDAKMVAKVTVGVAGFDKRLELGHNFFFRGRRGFCCFRCLHAFLYGSFSGRFGSGLHLLEVLFGCHELGFFNFTHNYECRSLRLLKIKILKGVYGGCGRCDRNTCRDTRCKER